MNTNSNTFKVRLGLFITIGLALFVLAIFVIGKQKNLFDPVFTLSTQFNNVSGLQVGNTVRFSGITVGTVDAIRIVNDSTVRVDMLIQKDVQRFIKNGAHAIIGSEGIIGDRVVVIANSETTGKPVRDGQLIASNEPVETDAIMASLQVTADNAALATDEITEILYKINNGDGTLGRLINDESIANNIDQTIVNLKSSTKGLDENMEAAKSNFLLRGYFKKKEKAAAKKKKEAEEQAKEAEEDRKKAAEKAAEKAADAKK
ncbi:MAG TPA: MlaD family protein [Flavobacterium sp.]|jgi:phospholipid/cholesterol/gamma-HCH transport system substrate-binding protein|nr:MlaD family protein [Flavobacterium sp.]